MRERELQLALPRSQPRRQPPLPRPRRNLWCVGRNYHAHAKELRDTVFKDSAKATDQWPIVFTKVPECVIGPGDTVAVFDYDSNRFLEAFFAVPMMGAVLQMVNWRLSAGQIQYTLNHAEAKIILINSDFLPILETIREKLETVRTIVVIAENGRDAVRLLEAGGIDLLVSDIRMPDMSGVCRSVGTFEMST